MNPRFPCFEAVLGTFAEIHECLVTCEDDDGTVHTFLIAVQCNVLLAINPSLRRLEDIEWRGGLVVMRTGARVLVTNLSNATYKGLAEKAVRK